MRKGQDLTAEFPGLMIIPQKIPGREVGRHSHDEHEFFLPLQGEITLDFAGHRVQGGPGRLIYAPPGKEHSFSSSAAGEGERVIFMVSPALWKKSGGRRLPALAIPAGALVRELVFFLLLNPKLSGIGVFTGALVRTLIEHLEASNSEVYEGELSVHLAGKIKDERIRKAMAALNEPAAQPPMSELARQSGISIRNFNRLFLAETGMTPKHYATRLKVEMAKGLLLKSRMTVTDISQEVGYQSLSKFIAAFQKYTGQLPSDFRHSSV
jgi:AraC-like DNA-binding protein